MIKCKMNLTAVVGNSYGGVKAFFNCRYDAKICEEDKGFTKATPAGMAEFQIDNPKASEQLVIGKDYYFDIFPCDCGTSCCKKEE